MAGFSHSSKTRLTTRDLDRFPGNTLIARIGRAVCAAGCLPRKELYEAWEMARRVRRRCRGGRVIDLAAGHGLLAHILLILDDSSSGAVLVDSTLPPSSAKLHESIVTAWPRLRGRVTFESRPLDDIALEAGDLVVSSHACGGLTDVVLERAAQAGARVAVLPCCQNLSTSDARALTGWVPGALAIDIMRAVRLEQRGYRVWTQEIPADITEKNRLLIAEPRGPGHRSQ